MLPGKKYKPEDFLWILWTRKWFVIIPTIVAAVGTFVWAWQLPNLYSSSTTILVIPQRVPESYVESTVTTSVAERLQTISSLIMSRTRLERIIEEFGLYPEERKTMIMEDIVELMKARDINLSVQNPRRQRHGETSHFSVSFKSPNPRTAMQVADRLSTMFVQENMVDRENLADSTSQFLDSQLADATRRLREHEAKVEEFKQRNSGQLPTQAQSNLQMVQMTQTQINNNNEAAAKERDRMHVLEGAIADATAAADQPLGGGIDTPSGSGAKQQTMTAAQALQAAQANLRALEQRFTPNHPDIGRAKREILELQARAAEEATRVAAAGGDPARPTGSKTPGPANSRLTQNRMEAEQLRKSLETRRAEDLRLQGVRASYRARLEMAPKLESELTELTRDYEILDGQYKDLLKKSEEAKLSVNLERRQIGEQFKVIDGARMPERPVSPNRVQLNLIGLLGGLAFGLAIVGLLEYRDTKLRTDDDVVISLALPVLAVIPAMVTHAEQLQRKRRKLILAVSTSLVVVLGVAAVVVWQLQLLRSWVR
jgi:protein tyrosine kinase modulator